MATYSSIPGAFLVAQTVKNLQYRKHRFNPWVRKIPWRREWQPTPVFLPGEFHGQRSWWSIVHGVSKNNTRLSNLHFHFHTTKALLLACCPLPMVDFPVTVSLHTLIPVWLNHKYLLMPFFIFEIYILSTRIIIFLWILSNASVGSSYQQEPSEGWVYKFD